MKKIFYTLLTLILFQTACGDRESEPDAHEIGEWELDSYIFSNLPTAFAGNEGRVFAVNEITFGGVAFESYDITLGNNDTYSRRIAVAGPDINDDGTWEFDGDDLTLIGPDDQEEVYSIERNETDQLWWSTETQFSLIEDAILDTLSADYFNSLTDTEQDALISSVSSSVSLDLVYAFERR